MGLRCYSGETPIREYVERGTTTRFFALEIARIELECPIKITFTAIAEIVEREERREATLSLANAKFADLVAATTRLSRALSAERYAAHDAGALQEEENF